MKFTDIAKMKIAASTSKNTTIVPVILCGGSGSRLWPISRQNAPKQFLPIYDESPLLKNTIDRAIECSGCSPDQIITVTSDALKKQTLFQYADFEPDAVSHLLAEPMARNTAAAVAYAAIHAKKNFGDDAILWILPSDHFVRDKAALKTSLNEAVNAAKDGYLVTFGMTPSRPETGYGYIKSGDALSANSKTMIVDQFVEKPNTATAEKYIESGDYLWNSGMFVFSVKTVLENFALHASNVSEPLAKSYSTLKGSNAIHPEIYSALPSLPFDIAIMEKTNKAAVIPCDIGWSDVGTWESVWEIKEKNSDGNVIDGRVASVNTKGCLIQSSSMLVATVGVENLVIIENGDSILIADKSDSSALKTVVETLKKQKAPELMDPTEEKRPWGHFKVLSQGKGFKIKETVVNPGEMMSLQMHRHRSELVTIMEGEAHIRIDEEYQTIGEKESLFIPEQTIHRIQNTGKKPLRYIEVQSGTYLGEDDIIRFDDMYGRITAAA